jgi:hypothetical protein
MVVRFPVVDVALATNFAERSGVGLRVVFQETENMMAVVDAEGPDEARVMAFARLNAHRESEISVIRRT